jgi:DDE superfamily endonuclease
MPAEPASIPSQPSIHGIEPWPFPLSRHPRWTFHFTPTSASWLNAVENFFSKMTRQRIRRGVFRSIADLQAAINAYLAEHNASPKPFVWTKSAEAILAKLDRCPVPNV